MKKFQKITGRALRALGCCALTLALGLPCACAQEVPELLEPVGVKMDTVAAYIGETKKIAVYEAEIAPKIEELYFTVDGTVAEVNVIIGQQVKAGDVLITLDQEELEEQLEDVREQIAHHERNAEYDDALAKLDLAMLETELRALMEQNPRNDQAIALKQLDIEQKQLDMKLSAELFALGSERLQAQVDSIMEDMADAELCAPFDGVVVFGKQLQRKSSVGAYEPVLYIADENELKVRTEYIPNTATENVHALYALVGGNRYDVTPVPIDDKEYISRVLSGETVMSEFEVLVPDDTIVSGAYAVLCIETQYVEDALLVPSNAIYSDGGGKYVYVVKNGERERVSVRTGFVTDWETQILEGIEEGAVVYVKD